MKKNDQIFIKALAKAVRKCTPPNKAISLMAAEYGMSSATTCTLVNGKKDFLITTIAKVAQAIGVKMSELMLITEEFLPENFSMFED